MPRRREDPGLFWHLMFVAVLAAVATAAVLSLFGCQISPETARAIRDGAETAAEVAKTALPPPFDVLVGSGLAAVSAYFGVNLRRNRTRKKELAARDDGLESLRRRVEHLEGSSSKGG